MKCIEDEIPFELPDSWAWTRFRVFCPYGDCEKFETSEIPYDAWVLDLEDIEKNTGKILAYATKLERNSISSKHRFYKGQVLYSKLRPYLNKVVIAPKDGYCTSEILPLKLYDQIQPKYIQLFLMSGTFLSYVNMISYGVKMPRLGTEDGRKALIALPPFKEQMRIIDKYDSIFPLIAELQLSCDELDSSISVIKSKILDLAIRGKLVPQNQNDEPASVLLERIRAEKEELIKRGKIKRDKKESVIFKGDDNSYYETIGGSTVCIDGELPFELPHGWEWCRLQTICYPITDGTHKTPTYSESGYIFLSAKNITTGKIDWQNAMYVPKSLHDELYSRISPHKNDILLAKNGTTGIAAIVDRECEFDIYVTLALIRTINCSIIPEYLLRIIASSIVQDYFKSSLKGIGVPNLHLEHIRTTLIPVSPLNEQKRIADKVSQLFSILDDILKNIV